MRRPILLIGAGITTMILLLVAFTWLAQASPGAPTHWSASYNISNSAGSVGATRPRIVADSNHYLHLVWVDDRSGNEDIFYARSTDHGTSWGGLQPITTTAFASWQGDIAAGPDGSLHSVWLEIQAFQSHGLEYATKADGGGWSTSSVAAPAFQLDPGIAVDGTYMYLAWQKRLAIGNPNIYYLRKPITDTVWPEPQLITDTVDGSITPDFAIDSGGNMHVVWHEQVPGGGAIWYSRGLVDGGVSWDPVINLSQGLTNCGTPAIAMGSDDYVHVVWGQKVTGDEQYVYYTNFPASDPGSMLSPIKIFSPGLGVSLSVPGYLSPRLSVEGTNTVHVVWHGKRLTDVTDEIWYSVSENKGANWSVPLIISRDPTSQSLSPDIVIDENLVHIVWQGKDPNGRFQVMYSRGFPSALYLPLALKAD